MYFKKYKRTRISEYRYKQYTSAFKSVLYSSRHCHPNF